MYRCSILSLCAMAALGLTLMPGSAFAQTVKDLVGTWKPVSIIVTGPDGRRSEPFGPNPNSILTFDANGRFVLVNTRPDLPKFASNNRMQGTAEENKATVQGSIAYFGTYSIVDKVIIEKVEGSTWPNWVGTEQKRPIISLTADEMKLSTPAASVGGTAENTYKRIK
jgi:Lipocalin-like domain